MVVEAEVSAAVEEVVASGAVATVIGVVSVVASEVVVVADSVVAVVAAVTGEAAAVLTTESHGVEMTGEVVVVGATGSENHLAMARAVEEEASTTGRALETTRSSKIKKSPLTIELR